MIYGIRTEVVCQLQVIGSRHIHISRTGRLILLALPALTVLLAAVLLPQVPTRLYQAAGFVVTGLILTLGIG